MFGYTGREHDEATGLNNYRARWYDPLALEFLSEDPLGFAGGDSNLSRYVGNRPVDYTDPSGMSWLSSFWNKVTSVVDDVFDDVGDFFEDTFEDVGDFFEDAFDDIGDFIQENPYAAAAIGVVALSVGAWYAVPGLMSSVGGSVVAMSKQAMAAVTSTIVGAPAAVAGKAQAAFSSQGISVLGGTLKGSVGTGSVGWTANVGASSTVTVGAGGRCCRLGSAWVVGSQWWQSLFGPSK